MEAAFRAILFKIAKLPHTRKGPDFERSIHRASGRVPPRRIAATAVPRKSSEAVLAILASRRHYG
ncbi:hypothetical protein N181_26205 [Sinorhizobium fredii USDA 205]|uniref:Uncharacterized protein n=1 Tax=Rhizobium fredii TaxID=380 RepID=A0A2A6M151_RHIFR|nr:hypothetical protein SF83666_c34920 [Sinorhizobium fredii CCBAU 83666]AWM26949.1 hypothetical protein AOX55_00003719 [Sinorhizobium fredii CCBAU 25509]KSV83134.1 hypothetical protein N181_26205 [Sinorhizobium fredii USDA 205]PDT48280.1 hypothetical protein CO661_10495 [Sinorhizobium fredii]GEC33877.1 hypothetical protein EFR01_40480 [Sinorhizobium fredii]